MFESEIDKQEDAEIAAIGQELPCCGLQGVSLRYDPRQLIYQKLMLHGPLTTHELQVAIGIHANEVPVEDFNAALNDVIAEGLVVAHGVKFALK
jgi:hypothetical protein